MMRGRVEPVSLAREPVLQQHRCDDNDATLLLPIKSSNDATTTTLGDSVALHIVARRPSHQ